MSFDKFNEIFNEIFNLNDEYKSQNFVNFVLNFDEIIVEHNKLDTLHSNYVETYNNDYKSLMSHYINSYLLKLHKIKTYENELSSLEYDLSTKKTTLSILEDNQIMANKEFDRAANQSIKNVIIEKLQIIKNKLVDINLEIDNIEGDIKSRIRSIESTYQEIDKSIIAYSTKWYALQRLFNKIEKVSLNINLLFDNKFTPLLSNNEIFITDMIVVDSFKKYLHHILYNLYHILSIDSSLNINEGTINHMLNTLGFTEIFKGFEGTKGIDIFAGKIKKSPVLKLNNLSFLANLSRDIYQYQVFCVNLDRVGADQNNKFMTLIYYTLLLSQNIYKLLFGNFGFLINVNNHKGLYSRGIISSNTEYQNIIPYLSKKNLTDVDRDSIKQEYWKIMQYLYKKQAIIIKNRLGIRLDFFLDIGNLFESVEHKLNRTQKLHLKINSKDP